jgi:hypothetical protein
MIHVRNDPLDRTGFVRHILQAVVGFTAACFVFAPYTIE